MASRAVYRQQEVRTSRVDWGVGGGLYDAFETEEPAVAVAWVRDLPPVDPSRGLPRVVGVAFRWRTRFDGRWELDTLYLSVFSRVLLLRLRWGVASLPAAVAGLLMSPVNLFVGDDIHMAVGVLRAAAGGNWMPQRQDLRPYAARRLTQWRLAGARPHEVLARTMLGWPEEYLVQTVWPFSSTEDDLEVQACVVAQHVVHFLWWRHRYIRGPIECLRWRTGRRAR